MYGSEHVSCPGIFRTSYLCLLYELRIGKKKTLKTDSSKMETKEKG